MEKTKGIQINTWQNKGVLLLLILEWVFIVLFLKQLKITNFESNSFVGEIYKFKIIYGGLTILVFLLFTWGVSFLTHIHPLVCGLFFFTSMVLFIEYQLFKYSQLSKNKKKWHQIKNEIKTGDLVFFETPQKLDSYLSLIPMLCLNINHMGILIKKDKVFMLDSNNRVDVCDFTQRTKNGVMVSCFETRMKQDFNKAYWVKTNLHEYVDNLSVHAFFEKYKDHEYMDENVNCVTLVIRFFKETHLFFPHVFSDVSNRICPTYQSLLKPENFQKPVTFEMIEIEM